MPKSKAEFKVYNVGADENVTLKITVGHGQVGATQAVLKQQTLLNENTAVDKIKHDKRSEWVIAPGAGADISGEFFVVTTVVADVRSETDKTSVNYELTGGTSDFAFSLEESVDQPGGLVIYNLTILFVGG